MCQTMIKMAAPVITPIFTCIYNEDILKIVRVMPIFKSGTVTDPNNYRPISIVPSL